MDGYLWGLSLEKYFECYFFVLIWISQCMVNLFHEMFEALLMCLETNDLGF